MLPSRFLFYRRWYPIFFLKYFLSSNSEQHISYKILETENSTYRMNHILSYYDVR